MTVNERFEAIIKDLFAGNKRAFALHVGISPTVVENVVGTRKGKPSFDVLEKVCANANVSAEWLLLGKGEMIRNAQNDNPQTTNAELLDLCKSLVANYQQRDDVMARLVSIIQNV